MKWLAVRWRHFMDWYGNYQDKRYSYEAGKYLSLVFLPILAVALFVIFFVLYALYG